MEAVIKEAKKAYKNSNMKKLDDLLAEQSRWKRKLTIATNKLADVRLSIDALACELVCPKKEEGK